MTRRKSRPLLPHEVFSNFQSSQEDAGEHANFSSSSAHESSQQQHSSSQSTANTSQSDMLNLDNTRQGKALEDAVVNQTVMRSEIAGDKIIARDLLKVSESSVKATGMSASDKKVDSRQPPIKSLIRSLSQTAPNKQRPGYLANRRSASFVVDKEIRNPPFRMGPTQGTSDALVSAPTHKQTSSSRVRLSMSLEGKAEVTTRTGDTPSPPRSQPVSTTIKPNPRSNTGLQRSYSALEPSSKSVSDVMPVPYTRRSMTGRSRDARTWEFYCDSDARNALTEQAEREESGSATAVIGLMRSCSNSSKVMTSNPNKRNAHTQKPDSTKRFKADCQRTGKLKLACTTSSVARLQTANSDRPTQKATNVGEKRPKGVSETEIWQDYEWDSDKENWEPGTQSSNPRRPRPERSHQATRILEESFRVPSHASSLDALMNCEDNISRRSVTKSSSSEEKENSGPEVDDEIRTFMGETGPREVEDLDCVQNLLSLSQAAWQ